MLYFDGTVPTAFWGGLDIEGFYEVLISLLSEPECLGGCI